MRAACHRGLPARHLSGPRRGDSASFGRSSPPSRAPCAPSLRRGYAPPSGYRGCPCAPARGSKRTQTARAGARRQARTWGSGAWASGPGLGCGGEGFLDSWGFGRRAAAPRWHRSGVARGEGFRAAGPSSSAAPLPPRPPPLHPRLPRRLAAMLRARRLPAAAPPQAVRRETRAHWACRPRAAAPPWAAAAALARATKHARKHARKRCQ